MIRLKSILDKIETDFNNPLWVDELVTLSKKDTKEFTSKLIEKEKNILISLFEQINYSVLEGEYVKNKIEFDTIIDQIKKKLGTLKYQQISEDDEEYSFTSIFQKEEFLYTLSNALDYYKRVSAFFHRIINSPHKNIAFDIDDLNYDEKEKYYRDSNKELEKAFLDLFVYNLMSTYYGFTLNDSIDDFKNLTYRISELNDLKSKIQINGKEIFHEIIDLLKEINVFHLRKLIIRKNQKKETYNEKYAFKGKEFHFTLEEHILEKELFKDWDEYSQNHFLSEKNSDKELKLRRNAEEYIQSSDLSRSFYKTHSLIKYYKDIDSDIVNLGKLKNVFSAFKFENDFDKYALNVSNNYLMNNIVSLNNHIQLKGKKDYNERCSFIEHQKSEIELLQKSSSVNNFFPYFKLCDFLKRSIESAISSENFKENDYLDNLKKASNELEELKLLTKRYRNNLNWSKNHLYNAFQLPFNECLLNYKTEFLEEINVFVPSAFSIPISYDKYDKNLKELDEFIVSSEKEIKSLKNISLLTTAIEKKEEELQNEIKNNLKKNIEVLAIFSAIIALLFQSVYTSHSSESIESKLYTLVIMFIILFSFMLMLRSLISNKKNDLSDKSIINALIFIFVPILLLVTLILIKI